ncbi:NAD(P)H-hydrate dehydratase [Tropicibacter sp. S64]|uniref:NAD(P)H-hydrate dehydratase n=1 Tax=Tropicibacter sp. S64 TaxID=3415122 RepID=UPI003C7B1790
MAELLTAAQMRAIEQAAIASGAVTGLELMERAGQGVVEAVFEEWPELAEGSHRAVVLCGPGNNGGDGFVVARLLKERGWDVEVFLYGDPSRLPPDAKLNYERFDGDVVSFDDWWDGPFTGPDLLVDALFGTGLARPIGGQVPELFDMLWDDLDLPPSERRALGVPRVVAIDLPSGLCSDSGRVLPNGCEHFPDCAAAELTVTFHAAKLGQILDWGPKSSGKVVVKSIGIEEDAAPRSSGIVTSIDWAPACIDKLASEHKYTHGHALILAGGFGCTGAARLAARGALRIGAGLVTLGVPGAAQMEVASQITALMLRRVEDAEGLAEVLSDDRLNALCLGPGMGLERAKALVPVALGGCGAKPRPTVLDADALSAFEDDPGVLFAKLHGSCVITPHMGEFARLFPDIMHKLTETPTKGPAYSKVDACREAAARAGCIVLFKGPDTVIAAPDGRCSVNAAVYDRAAPWLATAGSGDVLAGFITGLLARGFDPMQAAETAAWLHVECARSFGPGLIAEDLPEELPKVFRSLGQ